MNEETKTSFRIFPRRLYKSGTKWCFWRWTDVPTGYITRLHVIKGPKFAVCVHWLNHPDPEPYLHDHPVSFLSIILRGGYTERRVAGLRTHRLFNLVRSTTAHSITTVLHGTVTLCLMGTKVQEWGFYLPTGKMDWREYNKKYGAK